MSAISLVGQLTTPVMASIVVALVLLFLLGGCLVFAIRCYRKVPQGTAIVRNGFKGTKVDFSGMVVIPILQKAEYMDISVSYTHLTLPTIYSV